MMGCDGACAAGFDLVFIGLPLLSLYEIPMLRLVDTGDRILVKDN